MRVEHFPCDKDSKAVLSWWPVLYCMSSKVLGCSNTVVCDSDSDRRDIFNRPFRPPSSPHYLSRAADGTTSEA